ncbi:hypothetical protein E4U16_002115 [Claviceps sp. LM84 group G4]|nr:hypothetical protein E4U16_002115 [Claviceps sp. LM84 group G4]
MLTKSNGEFADQFPNTSVIGTDLSPCQPQWIPPNVRFEIDDATLDDDSTAELEPVLASFGELYREVGKVLKKKKKKK